MAINPFFLPASPDQGEISGGTSVNLGFPSPPCRAASSVFYCTSGSLASGVAALPLLAAFGSCIPRPGGRAPLGLTLGRSAGCLAGCPAGGSLFAGGALCLLLCVLPLLVPGSLPGLPLPSGLLLPAGAVGAVSSVSLLASGAPVLSLLPVSPGSSSVASGFPSPASSSPLSSSLLPSSCRSPLSLSPWRPLFCRAHPPFSFHCNPPLSGSLPPSSRTPPCSPWGSAGPGAALPPPNLQPGRTHPTWQLPLSLPPGYPPFSLADPRNHRHAARLTPPGPDSFRGVLTLLEHQC